MTKAQAYKTYSNAIIRAAKVRGGNAARRYARELADEQLRTNLASVENPNPACSSWNLDEVALSDCDYGCKVMRCRDCGDTRVVHSRTYGCPLG